jgi:NAD(P)H-dependent FMN reductase
MRIVGVCGSLQRSSSNRSLLAAVAAGAPEDVDVVLFEGLRGLPPFDPDLDAAGPPDEVHAWRRALAEADAVLVASPEYGHSLPGVLKNAIDWVIGSGELYRKVVAITAAVAHPSRGLRGLAALAQTLGAVDAVLAWNAPLVHEQRRFGPELGAMLAALVQAVRSRGASSPTGIEPMSVDYSTAAAAGVPSSPADCREAK